MKQGNKMNIDYSEYILSKSEKIRFLTISYIIASAVAFLFYHSIILSLALGLSAFFLLRPYSGYLAEKRRNYLLMQFKDMIYSMSSSLVSGRQLAESLSDSLEGLSLIYDDNSPLNLELNFMVRNINENRESEDQLLSDFAQRSHCEDIINFAEVCLICRKTGGDMTKVLSDTSRIITDKISIQKEIKSITAQKKLEGRIITVMPIAVVAGLNVLSPDYVANLYNTLSGRIIMSVSLLGIGFAYYLTERITKIEI